MANKHLTKGTLGYYDEDNLGSGTYATRNMAATPADTVTYALGEYIDSFPIPIEKTHFIDKTKFTGFDYGDLKQGSKSVEFTLPYILMEGPPLLYALGPIPSAPTGSDDAYVHTLEGMTPSDGVELPSRTFHIQMEDSLTTSRYIDICGVVTKTIDIGGNMNDPYIKVSESFVAQRITDENATTDLDGVASAGSEDDAQDFTNAPRYFDTNLTVNDAYYLKSITVGGTDITKDLVSWNIKIINELVPRRANRSGTDNYGRTINNYVGAWYLKSRRYQISLAALPTDETYPMWTRMQAGNVSDNDLVITFTRTKSADGVENTIVWTFDTSTCPIIDITGMVNFALANDQHWSFILQPKTLSSLVITDDIPAYGVYEPT